MSNAETEVVFGRVRQTASQIRDMHRTSKLAIAILIAMERVNEDILEPDALAMLTDALLGLGQIERFLAALEQEQDRVPPDAGTHEVGDGRVAAASLTGTPRRSREGDGVRE